MSLRLALKRSLGSKAKGGSKSNKRRRRKSREQLKKTLVLVCPSIGVGDAFDPKEDESIKCFLDTQKAYTEEGEGGAQTFAWVYLAFVAVKEPGARLDTLLVD